MSVIRRSKSSSIYQLSDRPDSDQGFNVFEERREVFLGHPS